MPTTHVLLDFFGTLVDYSASRTEQGYARSHALLLSLGADLSYDQFLQAWSAESSGYDERSALDDSEFSMEEVSAVFLARVLNREPDGAEIAALVDTYLAEWNTGVVYPATTSETVDALASRFRLAVVTNTHQADLVPKHLSAMGIADRFEAVVTSVEVGRRKPHPAIYAETLGRLGIPASNAIFVGDDYQADYAGPRAAGMAAFLIGASAREEVPGDNRLTSLAELPERLGLAAAV
jgi:putative hydrolase of the HAD superfamily